MMRSLVLVLALLLTGCPPEPTACESACANYQSLCDNECVPNACGAPPASCDAFFTCMNGARSCEAAATCEANISDGCRTYLQSLQGD
jgi:hypothetical protein